MGSPHSLVDIGTITEMLKLAEVTPAHGCFLEVGVYKGGTAWHLDKLATQQGRWFICYDTFEGMPNQHPLWDRHKIGEFADTSYEEVQRAIPDAIVVKGVFPDCASKEFTGKYIAFAHVDCDQYESVHKSIWYLLPRMLKGGVIWFDDSPNLEGAKRAVREWFTAEQIKQSSTGNQEYVVL